MSKEQDKTRLEWAQWMFSFVCFSSAIAALVTSFSMQTKITSLYERLDEQREVLAQLDNKISDDQASNFHQEVEQSDSSKSESSECKVTCVNGDGCLTWSGDMISFPTAHLTANKTKGLHLWYPDLLFGGMRVVDSHLIIPYTGKYFVYCQMQYRDSNDYHSSLLVNGQSVFDNIKLNYQSWLLRLKCNDTVTVLPDMSHLSQFSYHSSFFGAYYYTQGSSD
ncbi:uncharacterized protein LOC134196698 isoform X2 [Corticium candelabrum]|uniref:uncharacterized protein LOC134196698 isoform X2 n=1 Tax=Corticium candelabrum TaxID=121492 RepID=UPI002E277549|nr:uncharacterized protein LOC134196698 isoform X2 [Corticium candelabrum]